MAKHEEVGDMVAEKFMVGCIENCDLPGLGILDMEVRVDTGAKTSSLHVDNIKKFKKSGKTWVSFDIHPTIHNVDEIIRCESPLRDVRKIKSSNGSSEERYIIRTLLRMNKQEWKIDLSLTDRSDMSYLMLLGREGMLSRIIVDPSETFLLSSD
jgi:hypothetical protein